MPASHPAARVDIDAPLDSVWSAMSDLSSYGEWNSFIRRADCATPPKVGDPIRLHVTFRDGTRVVSPERIVHLRPPYVDNAGVRRASMAYVYEGLPSRLGLIRGVRWQQVAQLDGATRYETVELFAGPLVRLAGPGRVAEGFSRHADDLKRRAEERSASRLRP